MNLMEPCRPYPQRGEFVVFPSLEEDDGVYVYLVLGRSSPFESDPKLSRYEHEGCVDAVCLVPGSEWISPGEKTRLQWAPWFGGPGLAAREDAVVVRAALDVAEGPSSTDGDRISAGSLPTWLPVLSGFLRAAVSRHLRHVDEDRVIGDMIQQKHQRGAVPRLVVAYTDDPSTVWVFDPDGLENRRYKKVFTWSHELVAPATDASRAEAEDHLLSEAFAGKAWR